MAWLSESELRVGLGCMRLSTDEDRDEERALATIAAAACAGVTLFDTARAYGDNEQLLADSLRQCGRVEAARIMTKGGMSRPGGAWVPDGRARSIRADCEASLDALGGLAIDLYLIHAPDPRTPWRTAIRALARLLDDGLVARIGVANVNRDQLDEALELAPIAAVQVALSPVDDRALRGGVVERCVEAGLSLIAHSPLGGPRRARTLDRVEPLAEVAAVVDASAQEVALAWLLDLAPNVVAIPGARRPETARSSARAASIRLGTQERERLRAGLGGLRARKPARRRDTTADVLVVMGVPGAGKSLLAEEYVGRGYVRLNRDERGGSLRDLADELESTLASGGGRVVLDNTYLTRASRSYVVETAARHGVPARCAWLDTPLAQAQINIVERLLDRFGELPAPETLKTIARAEPGLLAPTSQMRAFRELEPPSLDEGFAEVEHIVFTRAPHSGRSRTGVFVAAPALDGSDWEEQIAAAEPGAPHLLFDWRPGGSPADLETLGARLARSVTGPVDVAVCPHPGGPPTCWCRPALPGLPLAFARAHDIDAARSILIGTSPPHRTLANALGARYVPVAT